MSLPRPPISLNTPIPNEPFSAEEVYYLEGNQGHLPLGAGLYIDPATGEFTDIEPSPFIYCTPQYSNLPPTEPPYDCNTEVNTAGVTNFSLAWFNCAISEMPCVDTSSGTNFDGAWSQCDGLTSFPSLNVSGGESFYETWQDCTGLTSFPLLDLNSGLYFSNCWKNCTSLSSFPPINFSSGTDFDGAWSECTSLASFPLLDVSSGINFSGAWQGCSSLTTFPAGMFDSCLATSFFEAWSNCALNQTSVDNILVSLDTAGQSNGNVNISGGTSSAPGPAGLAAKASLQGKGWTVSTN